MKTGFHILVAFVAIAVTSLTAMAQEPDDSIVPYQDPALPPPPQSQIKKDRLRNHVKLHVIHLRRDEENPHPYWAMPMRMRLQDPWEGRDGTQFDNRFEYWHETIFGPQKKTTAELLFDVSLAGGAMNIKGRTDVFRTPVPITGDPDTPPMPTKPGLGGSPNQKSSKPLILGTNSSDEETDSDSTFLVGPELTMPVKYDMTDWEMTGWLPRGSQLFIYGKALFGEVNLYGDDSDVALYGAGAGVRLPLIAERGFGLDGLVSAGPSYLDSDFGGAVGLDAAAGLGASVQLAGDLYLTGSAKLNVFTAENVWAWGPVFGLGLTLSW